MFYSALVLQGCGEVVYTRHGYVRCGNVGGGDYVVLCEHCLDKYDVCPSCEGEGCSDCNNNGWVKTNY